MDPLDVDIVRRSKEFAERYSLRINDRLGYGKDGTVWSTDGAAALKIFRRQERFARELAVYQRLTLNDVSTVAGHNVPRLIGFDESLLAIQMTIVERPFILDFASAYLDGTAPVFPDEVMEEWLADKKEQFGSNWSHAASVLAGLRRYGIQMTDIHPGNIGFESG